MIKKAILDKKEVDPIQFVWGLICLYSSVDQDSKNISMFSVVEQFNLPSDKFEKQSSGKVSFAPIQFEIVIFWKRTLSINISPEELLIDFKIKTVDPSGKVIQEMISPIKFQAGKKRLRYRIMIPALPFTIVGDYCHQIELKSNGDGFKKVGEIPFEIIEQKLVARPS